jgi:hypothetical protein
MLQAGQFANTAQQQQYDQMNNDLSTSNSAVQGNYANAMQSAGYNNALRTSGYQELANNATLQNAARQQSIQEQSYLRNMPLNDISALLGTTGGIQQPQFSGVPQLNMQAPALDQYIQNQYQGNMQNYQMQMQQRNALIGAIGGMAGSLGSAAIMSDSRMKKNIVHVSTLPNGTPMYSFEYIDTPGIQFGTMAQDVEHIPGAVSELEGGIKMVDYEKVYAHV